jgi:predicted nuclease of predicted toxin-antitoxin system
VRLYLDQMFRAELAEALRAVGHDVIRASEVGQARADDALILERAVREERILVTLDEHFGDWVVLPLSEHFGVIRVKTHPPTTKNIVRVLLPLLLNRAPAAFRNRLVIVSANRARWIRTATE